MVIEYVLMCCRAAVPPREFDSVVMVRWTDDARILRYKGACPFCHEKDPKANLRLTLRTQ